MEIIVTTQSGQKLNATLIHVYERENCDPTSAPTFRSMAAAIFSQVPQAGRVALICTRGHQILFLVEAAHQWFDVGADPCQISKAPTTNVQGTRPSW